MTAINHRTRLGFIDWLRGASIVLMVIYHFCYDLDFFGYIDTAFGQNYWVPFRYVIVIGFLTLVGVSLVFVHSNGVNWRSVQKRSLQLLLASIAVTVSSYFVDPRQFTIFGILQLILVSSWLALPFVKHPRFALLTGVLIFALGHIVKTPIFEPLWLHWLGMVEQKRAALDYVPIFPWFGLVLIGIYVGHWFANSERGRNVARIDMRQVKGLSVISRVMEKAGQHSLIIYLVHQPVMFGAFYLLSQLH